MAMDKNVELHELRERALVLQDTIEDIDYQIERAMHAVAAGTFDVGHAIMVLESRRNDHAGLMFELGKVTAQIEDMENRIHEHEERGVELQAIEDWEAEMPVAGEDHLDWLRPILDAPEPEMEHGQNERHPQRSGEEQMLEAMHREVEEPEDYPDWWKR